MATYQSALRRIKRFGISASVLRIIALLSMLIDHFAVIVIRNGKLYGYSEEYYAMALATAEGQRWLRLYEICRVAGRLSFPLFCFLLVQGFVHTSNLRKYVLRVLILALVSELPYDLAMSNATYDLAHQNVCFTLLIGLLVMAGMKRYRLRTERKWGCVLLGCLMAYLLRGDYAVSGVLMIALMYNFRKEKLLQLCSGVAISGYRSFAHYGAGVLAFIPAYFYNGEQGRLRAKWLYYSIYPLHMLVFYIMIYIGAML